MLGLLIGFVVGASIATNYNLRPFYEETVKTGLETGLEKVTEYCTDHSKTKKNQ